jgi:hypothetical protein
MMEIVNYILLYTKFCIPYLMCEKKKKHSIFFNDISTSDTDLYITLCYGGDQVNKNSKLFKSQDVVCHLDGTENDGLPHYKISDAIQQTNIKLLLRIPTTNDVKLRVSHGRINGNFFFAMDVYLRVLLELLHVHFLLTVFGVIR